MCPLTALGEPLFIYALTFIQGRDIANCTLVCKRWAVAVKREENLLWKEAFLNLILSQERGRRRTTSGDSCMERVFSFSASYNWKRLYSVCSKGFDISKDRNYVVNIQRLLKYGDLKILIRNETTGKNKESEEKLNSWYLDREVFWNTAPEPGANVCLPRSIKDLSRPYIFGDMLSKYNVLWCARLLPDFYWVILEVTTPTSFIKEPEGHASKPTNDQQQHHQFFTINGVAHTAIITEVFIKPCFPLLFNTLPLLYSSPNKHVER